MGPDGSPTHVWKAKPVGGYPEEYSRHLQILLEECFQKDKFLPAHERVGVVPFEMKGILFEIDLKKMKQYNVEDRSRVREVTRDVRPLDPFPATGPGSPYWNHHCRVETPVVIR